MKFLRSPYYLTIMISRRDLDEIIQWIRLTLHWETAATTFVSVHQLACMQDAQALLSQWLAAFSCYSPQPGGMHEKEFLRRECLLLRAHHRAASIMLAFFSPGSEKVFDGHLDSFKSLLQEISATFNHNIHHLPLRLLPRPHPSIIPNRNPLPRPLCPQRSCRRPPLPTPKRRLLGQLFRRSDRRAHNQHRRTRSNGNPIRQ